jgi:thiosulfate dehydrogenase [quinone] large subunit
MTGSGTSAVDGVVALTAVVSVTVGGLGAFGAGRIHGVDAYLEDFDVVEANPWLRCVLG